VNDRKSKIYENPALAIGEGSCAKRMLAIYSAAAPTKALIDADIHRLIDFPSDIKGFLVQ